MNENDETLPAEQLPPELDHISTVRRHMLDQLRALRTAPRGEELSIEIRRSKAVTEVAQTIINAARVEVDYVNAVRGAAESAFLQEPDEGRQPKLPAAPQSALPTPETAVTRSPLDTGPATDHPWRGGSTVHRLKG
jgi:hypothetical protein